MGRKLLIAGNWKMNKTAGDAAAFVRELARSLGAVTDVDVVVCPPFTSLVAAVQAAKGTCIAVGAQNVHWADSGAFTGEISAAMLKEAQVSHVIIGHSERRQFFGETDQSVNKRLLQALAAGLTPIVCVGETLAEREAGRTAAVVTGQMQVGFGGLTEKQALCCIVAYEPVWAIGTGKTATPEQAQEVHALIRSLLQKSYATAAGQIRILYGGSVKAANTKELMAQPDIDGGLVGGASLTLAEFSGIVGNARTSVKKA